MGIAERHFQRAHQPISEIGGGCITAAGRFFHGHRVGLHISHHARHSGDAKGEGGEGIKHAFFIFLHVLGVR